jgi:hypothetical protein
MVDYCLLKAKAHRTINLPIELLAPSRPSPSPSLSIPIPLYPWNSVADCVGILYLIFAICYLPSLTDCFLLIFDFWYIFCSTLVEESSLHFDNGYITQ